MPSRAVADGLHRQRDVGCPNQITAKLGSSVMMASTALGKLRSRSRSDTRTIRCDRLAHMEIFFDHEIEFIRCPSNRFEAGKANRIDHGVLIHTTDKTTVHNHGAPPIQIELKAIGGICQI